MYCHICAKDPLEMREINYVLDERDEEIIICDKCLQKFCNKVQPVNR